MCLAAPAKVIEIYGDRKAAKVSVGGNEMEINISMVSPEIGDYVLVHAGCAIEIIKEDTAAEMTELYKSLEEITQIEQRKNT